MDRTLAERLIAGLGARHVLPILQLIVYCALAVWGFSERYPPRKVSLPSQLLLVQDEGATAEWNPTFIDGPPPRGFRIATAINFPAAIPALLIVIPGTFLLPNPSSFRNDMLAMVSMGLFVPVIWYGVGWWIDHRLGRRPPKLLSLSGTFHALLIALALIMSIPLLVLSGFAVIGIMFGGVSRHQEIIGVFPWSGWVFWISLSQARRWRSSATTSPQNPRNPA